MKPKKTLGKGQGTLFSFFSKKEPTNKNDRPDPICDAQPQLSSHRDSSIPADKKATSTPSDQDAQMLVGKHVKVFWPDDQEWFTGEVIYYSAQDGKHTIHYTDGDRERVILANERVSISLLHLL